MGLVLDHDERKGDIGKPSAEVEEEGGGLEKSCEAPGEEIRRA